MGTGQYVCTICAQDFGRKTSANRHNNNLHHGRAVIVSTLEYIVGRVTGKYHAADPKLYRRNANRNRYFLQGIDNNKNEPRSYADIFAPHENHVRISNQLTDARPGSDTSDSRALQDTLELAAKALTIKKLANEIQKQPLDSISLMSNFLSSLLQRNQTFGFLGYSCPNCAYWTVYQLEYGKVNWVKTIEQANHSCGVVSGPKNRENDILPFIVSSFSRVWLNDRINLLALRLPLTFFPGHALFLTRDRSDSSESTTLPISKGSPIVLEPQDEGHWSTRAVSGEKKSVPISISELHDFLRRTGQGTYGVFSIQTLNEPLRQKNLYFLFIGRFSSEEELFLQLVPEPT